MGQGMGLRNLGKIHPNYFTQEQKNTSTGLAGGCHLTGIALCSSLDASNA